VLENRLLGLSEREAIAAGVAQSGPLISAAGCIMALAFGALLFASPTALNELGFLLTLSVLVDTFVVRTVLVPAVMSLLGRANWWPRVLPTPVPSAEPVSLQRLSSERERRAAPAAAAARGLH
jgi:uncharacterized membrane protein YdfJ with MMPL/SSD domain